MLQNSMELGKIEEFIGWCEKHFSENGGEINLLKDDATSAFESMLKKIKPKGEVARRDAAFQASYAQAKPNSLQMSPAAQQSTWSQLDRLNINKIFLPVSAVPKQQDDHHQAEKGYSRSLSPA
jgi:hypothetical protein